MATSICPSIPTDECCAAQFISKTPSSPSSPNVGLIVGIVVVILLIAAVIFGFLWLNRRRAQKRFEEEQKAQQALEYHRFQHQQAIHDQHQQRSLQRQKKQNTVSLDPSFSHDNLTLDKHQTNSIKAPSPVASKHESLYVNSQYPPSTADNYNNNVARDTLSESANISKSSHASSALAFASTALGGFNSASSFDNASSNNNTTSPFDDSAKINTNATTLSPDPSAPLTPVTPVITASPLQTNTESSDPTRVVSLSAVTLRIVHPYTPTLADELSLVVGNEVILLQAFDDGWALGMDPLTGVQGAFPVVCVAHPDDQTTPSKGLEDKNVNRISKRVSSASANLRLSMIARQSM